LKRNFKLTLEYDGSCYHGWQRQHGVLTIQEVLESRLEIILGEPIRTRASGRTDAGVHASGQVVGFYTHTGLEPEAVKRGLNSLLPPDIVVLQAEEMELEFHACFSAASKLYEYRILNRPTPSALERRFAWHIRRPLNKATIAECLESITGVHDFSAFMAAGSSVTSTERRVYRATIEVPDRHHLVCYFEANGFLRHMVRNLVGTLVDVGKGKLTPGDFLDILVSRDRRRAGMTAPAHGLYLVSVRYEGFPDCLKGRD
jgi:tRNA pseudouridine38-40 synthase